MVKHVESLFEDLSYIITWLFHQAGEFELMEDGNGTMMDYQVRHNFLASMKGIDFGNFYFKFLFLIYLQLQEGGSLGGSVEDYSPHGRDSRCST